MKQQAVNMFDQVVRGIHVSESEDPPVLIDMEDEGAFFFNKKFASGFLLRKTVCDKIKAAQDQLPAGFRFMLYEAFRPRSRQLVLWDQILHQLKAQHPEWNDEQYREEAERFVANPHGFGSGHQAAAAVDITLCTDAGEELCMGTQVQEFNPQTRTDCRTIRSEEIERRKILCAVLGSQDIVNYPEEWWHFSHGDRLWAEIKGRDKAFFAPIAEG